MGHQWAKLARMNAQERESHRLREKQKRQANEFADEIKFERAKQAEEKAASKARHILRMQAIADSKKRRK